MIRESLVGVALLGLLTGCTSDWDTSDWSAARRTAVDTAASTWSPVKVDNVPSADVGIGSVASASHPRSMRAASSASPSRIEASRAPADFASLPDRGELLAYDSSRTIRISGAYRAYPVRLSEEHALKAAHPGGWMVIKTPDDKKVELAYESHVEHPDGNWSWIGRDAKGADAVITFGAAATFGTLPLPDGETLRLTMAGGYAWLVVTDRSKIEDINRAVTRAGKKDYLIPPKLASAAASDKARLSKAGAESVAARSAAATQATVDVVVGYTAGLAAALGGSSQAVTRINNLVVAANQAYANSAVNARLRLVGTVLVQYPDNNDNGTALEQLTGQTDSGPTTPHPAFAALRAARETYGADLVSLLRDFRAPENNGCGIAWLLGGGQSGIGPSDAPFGYSVVSDGTDVDEGDGNPYSCREESFAHELGHNMGQAHNTEDSTISGVHSYSYGYREAFTSGFYTVMAYSLPNSDQTAIRYFANPAITFDGRPTGVANASDNARSINLVVPIIAGFRAGTASPSLARRNDANGDGKSDLLWSRPSSGRFSYWLMNGATITSAASFAAGSGYVAIGTGDMDGNGRADIIWRNAGGNTYIWLGQPSGGYASQLVAVVSTTWKLVGTGDVNGDGKSDLLWSNPASGQLRHWVMNGSAIAGTASFVAGSAFTALGTGDLDGNGRADIIWQNAGGHTYVWLGQTSGGYSSQFIVAMSTDWKLAGVGDVSADGKSDLMWSRRSTGQLASWVMNGAAISSSATFAADSSFAAIGTGDMDGDGRTDVVWQNNSGHVYVWLKQASGGYTSHYVHTLYGWTLLP